MRNLLIKTLAAGIVAAASAQAATNVIDFNTDPALSGLYTWFGNLADINGNPDSWRSSGGASGGATDGYLAITDSAGGSHSALVFKDLENGLIIKSFVFECDVRIGGGTASPADGFSVNVASSTDPTVVAADAGNDPVSGFAGTDGEPSGLPEEGTVTGLGVGFDQWDSGALNQGTFHDTVGISIRVDNTLLCELPVPLGTNGSNVYFPNYGLPGTGDTRYVYDNSGTYNNVATNDPNYFHSLQTGAVNTTDVLSDGNTPSQEAQPAYGDPNYDLWIKNLKWEHFRMEVTDDSHVKISYKGNELTPPGGLATSFSPRAARIVFGGRTGGAWSAMDVDNIRLVTTPFTSAALSGFTGNAGGFTVQISDQGTITLDPASLVLQLNGTAVTPTVSKTGSVTTAHYTALPPLAIGSTNTVNISFKDNFGIASAVTRVFVAGSYATLPPSYALPAAATITDSGFDTFVDQITIGRFPGDANSTADADRQLAGGYIDPTTGVTYANVAHPGTYSGIDYLVPLINWNEHALVYGNTGDADIGDFKTGGTPPGDLADNVIPGIDDSGVDVADPTMPGYDGNIVSRSTAYLTLKKGYYSFGVNSDDGFRVSFAFGAPDTLGLTAGEYNGGKGSSDVLFDVYVPADGVYPVRLEWWQGGGGANCEFFYIDQVTATKRLINDTRDSANEITAFAKSSLTRPYVLAVSPERNQVLVLGNADIWAEVANGTTPVDAGSVALWVNGVKASSPATSSSGLTTIKQSLPAGTYYPGGSSVTNTLVYSFTESGATTWVTNTWVFGVAPYVTVDPGLSTPIGSGDTNFPGFRIKTWQLDLGDAATPTPGTQANNRAVNLVAFAEQELQGLFGTNSAATNGLGADGYFHETGVINYDKDPTTDGPQGNFPNDNLFPGIPGNAIYSLTTENFALEIQTYVEFPAGGFYNFGFNSDDGFATYPSAGPGPIFALNVNSPSSISGAIGAVSGGTDEGGIFAPLPTTAITGKLVYADPPIGSSSGLNNAAAVKGNILLIDRGTLTFNAKLQNAIDAGAIGVVVANSRGPNVAPADGITPIVMGGTANPVLPGVMINIYDGQKLKAHLGDAGGVTVTLGADPTPRLGVANYGRGATDTIYGFVIPQAGVYPMRSVYFQGGGGASAEWFAVNPFGTKILLNDSATAGALKAYQKVTVAAKPTLSLAVDGVNVKITFTGTLQSSASVAGPYADVAGQSSPLIVPLNSITGNLFYRSRN
jgi:hypothetical protein